MLGTGWDAWDARRRRIVLGAAILFRLTALFLPPQLSDDIYRYRWDGKVSRAGVNPYRHAPDAPELERWRDEEWQWINHRELRTIYPPAAQAAFWGASIIGSSLLVLKLSAAAAELATLALLVAAAGRGHVVPWALAAYAWSPLVLFEVYASAHVDVAVGLGLLALGLAAARPDTAAGPRRGRPAWLAATLIWSAAVLVKLLPLALAPLVARRWGWRAVAAAALVVVLAYLPFAGAGAALFESLGIYASRWESNDFAYTPLSDLLAATRADELAKDLLTAIKGWFGHPAAADRVYYFLYPGMMARLLLAATALLAMVWMAVARPPGRWAAAYGFVLLCLPVLHPWYLLGLLPIAVSSASVGWILLAYLAGLAYCLPAMESLAGPDLAPALLRVLEFGPPLALLAVQGWRRRSAVARLVWGSSRSDSVCEAPSV